MAVITEDQPEAAPPMTAQDIGAGATTSEKPRARLGETEVVQLHNSDSEDEAQEAQIGEDGEGEAFNDPDFLQDYPDDITASSRFLRYLLCRAEGCIPVGSAPATLAAEHGELARLTFPSIWKAPTKTMSPAEQPHFASAASGFRGIGSTGGAGHVRQQARSQGTR